MLKFICKQHIRFYATKSSVRIGCASGFWGDTAVAAPQLIYKGNVDYIVFDYLSEITMSLLAAAKQRNQNMGYTPDFVEAAIGPYLADIKKKGIRIVSNGGGINPLGCVNAIKDIIKKQNIQDLKIAMVTGDDIMDKKDSLLNSNIVDMFSSQKFPSTMTSMTAYLGASAIKKALDEGADIVVTGRCTDSALALGPLMHTFNWKFDEYNFLAAGSLAGHLIECGAQSTGGNFTDWHEVQDWHNMGFPIVECSSDGTFILSKPLDTGGLITTATVAEQLVYEIGDPANYLLPDVNCDFTGVKLQQIGENQVKVSGAVGRPPTNFYKISGTYMDGFRLTAVAVVKGGKASDKAKKTAEAILNRTKFILKKLGIADFSNVNVETIGSEQSFGSNATPSAKSIRECVLWMAVSHLDKKPLEILAREIAPSGTGMAPGLCAIVGGRPKVSPVLKLFSFLYSKDDLEIKVHLEDNIIPISTVPAAPITDKEEIPIIRNGTYTKIKSGDMTYRLEQLAYLRSGDKGNTCNIGVIARHPEYVPYLKEHLTSKIVAKYFQHYLEDQNDVHRYELPGINAFNFLLKNVLGGGGIASLRSDPQGKAYAQMLMDLEISNLPDFKI